MKRKYFFVILFLTLAIFLTGCSGSGVTTPPITTNQSPTASFTANPTSGVAPLNVSFNASSSSDSDGSIISYAWDFKDGTTGNGETVNHTFSSIGNYNVKLTVTDDKGATASTTKTITVTETPNQSPTASFTANPTSGASPLQVTFDASSSYDSDGTIVSYAWDFKDEYTGNGETLNHTFNSTGNYNVKLTVTDDKGATDSATKTITVTEPITPPVVTPPVVGGDFYICENLLRGFYTALSNQNFTQALSYCKPGGATFEYVNNLWNLDQQYPTFYMTYQVYDVYNFSYIGQSVVSFNYDLSSTSHSIYGETYDTNYYYGMLALFEKVNGEWKMS